MNNNFLDGGGILCQGVESPRVLRRLVGVSQADWVSDLGNERAKITSRWLLWVVSRPFRKSYTESVGRSEYGHRTKPREWFSPLL